MKTKIKATDFDGTITVLEKEAPAKDHLAAQIKYKVKTFENKKAYKRKPKYKPDYLQEIQEEGDS